MRTLMRVVRAIFSPLPICIAVGLIGVRLRYEQISMNAEIRRPVKQRVLDEMPTTIAAVVGLAILAGAAIEVFVRQVKSRRGVPDPSRPYQFSVPAVLMLVVISAASFGLFAILRAM